MPAFKYAMWYIVTDTTMQINQHTESARDDGNKNRQKMVVVKKRSRRKRTKKRALKKRHRRTKTKKKTQNPSPQKKRWKSVNYPIKSARY